MGHILRPEQHSPAYWIPYNITAALLYIENIDYTKSIHLTKKSCGCTLYVLVTPLNYETAKIQSASTWRHWNLHLGFSFVRTSGSQYRLSFHFWFHRCRAYLNCLESLVHVRSDCLHRFLLLLKSYSESTWSQSVQWAWLDFFEKEAKERTMRQLRATVHLSAP